MNAVSILVGGVIPAEAAGCCGRAADQRWCRLGSSTPIWPTSYLGSRGTLNVRPGTGAIARARL
jgi:hypothetical protein